MRKILSYGVHVINDSYEIFKLSSDGNEICIGGLVCGRDMDPSLNLKEPDLDFLQSFGGRAGYKILLCHYPHYYEKYLKQTDIDLVLSGHAHGGQWRFFGRGIFAPGQGFFPKYTSGFYDGKHGKMLVGRGLGDSHILPPRINNKTEIIEVTLVSND
jgi:hypothetical protein